MTASESVTTAIDEAERQNRQQAIVMAAAAVVTSLIAAFVLLQILSGGDSTVQDTSVQSTGTAALDTSANDASSNDSPAIGSSSNDGSSNDGSGAVAFDGSDDSDEPTDASDTPSTADVIDYTAPDALVGDKAMTLRGMGDIAIGMSVAEAETAIGGTIIELEPDANGCAQTRIGGDLQSPVLMVVGTGEFSTSKIVRIDMVSGNATRSGIGIGSPAADVLNTYGERIEAIGETLTYVPSDEADADYRIVMNVVGDVVLSAHNGVLPYVNWDGCNS